MSSNGEITKQGQVTVTASTGTKKDSEANKDGSQANPVLEKEYVLPPRRFQETNYSKVGLTIGLTKSLGNFEFLRVDVYAEDFCEPEKKTETWDALHDLAGEYCYRVATNIESYISEKKNGKNKEKLGF